MLKIKFFPKWPLTNPNIRITNSNIRGTILNIRVNKRTIWMCGKKFLIIKILDQINDKIKL